MLLLLLSPSFVKIHNIFIVIKRCCAGRGWLLEVQLRKSQTPQQLETETIQGGVPYTCSCALPQVSAQGPAARRAPGWATVGLVLPYIPHCQLGSAPESSVCINLLQYQRVFEKQGGENSADEGKVLKGFCCQCAHGMGVCVCDWGWMETEEQTRLATDCAVDLE